LQVRLGQKMHNKKKTKKTAIFSKSDPKRGFPCTHAENKEGQNPMGVVGKKKSKRREGAKE